MGDEGTTILVASPDTQVQELLARVVETVGLSAVRLDAAVDIAEAVAVNAADGLILDLGAGNLEALQAVRARPEPAGLTAVVIVIGTGPAGGRLAWQAGADGFLIRPFHARDLQASVTNALALDPAGRAARRAAGLAELAS